MDNRHFPRYYDIFDAEPHAYDGNGVGADEIDEVYVGIHKHDRQYVIPVQAKGDKDRHDMVQTLQDITCYAERFPSLLCRPISAQFMGEGG